MHWSCSFSSTLTRCLSRFGRLFKRHIDQINWFIYWNMPANHIIRMAYTLKPKLESDAKDELRREGVRERKGEGIEKESITRIERKAWWYFLVIETKLIERYACICLQPIARREMERKKWRWRFILVKTWWKWLTSHLAGIAPHHTMTLTATWQTHLLSSECCQYCRVHTAWEENS